MFISIIIKILYNELLNNYFPHYNNPMLTISCISYKNITKTITIFKYESLLSIYKINKYPLKLLSYMNFYLCFL